MSSKNGYDFDTAMWPPSFMRWSLYKKEAKASGIKNAVANQHFRTPRTNTKKMWSDCHESQKNCLLNLMEYHTTHKKGRHQNFYFLSRCWDWCTPLIHSILIADTLSQWELKRSSLIVKELTHGAGLFPQGVPSTRFKSKLSTGQR